MLVKKSSIKKIIIVQECITETTNPFGKKGLTLTLKFEDQN